MKTLIIIIATIVLGVIIWGLILGTGPDSLLSQAKNVLKIGVDQMKSLVP
ncbi:MAG: hypothetical protein ACYDIA_03725 [Candidatus Humimicrobiaceae bacterium]